MKPSPLHSFGRLFQKASLLSLWLCLASPGFVKAQPIEVIPSELHGAVQPQMAVAPNQKIYVAFAKENRIYCASSADHAKTFLPPQEVARLPKLALGMRRGPRIVASDNRVTVSAVSSQDGNLYAWTSGDGGQTWAHGVMINSVPHAAREGLHAMAGDSHGNIYAVWLDSRDNGMQLWGAGSRDGGQTWGGNVKIYQSPDGHICECCHPSVEFGPKGSVRVMWRNWLGGSRDMYTAVSADGGKTFGAVAKLGLGTWPLNACPMDGGSLAGPCTVWRRGTTIYYTDDKPDEHPLGEGRQPVVALARNGPYFVWSQGNRLMLKKGPSAPVMLTPSGAYPVIAVASDDQSPIVTWESTLNGVQTILAQVLK